MKDIKSTLQNIDQKMNSTTDSGEMEDDDDFPDFPEGESEDSAIDQEIKKYQCSKKRYLNCKYFFPFYKKGT